MKYKCLVSCSSAIFSYQAGETVDITNEEVAKDLLNAHFIEPLGDEVVEDSNDKFDASKLETKKLAELKEICRNLGLEAKGSKTEMIAAITEAYNG